MILNYFMCILFVCLFKILYEGFCCVGTQEMTPHFFILIRISDIIFYDRLEILPILRYACLNRSGERRELEFQ